MDGSWQKFDDGRFTEDELRVIKRMMPSSLLSRAKLVTRRSFFHEALIRAAPASVAKLKKALYQIHLGLSKRLSGDPDRSSPSLPLSPRQF